MRADSVTILGGGNTAFAAAAELTLAGASVTLCELPSFRHAIEPILATREISLDGVARRGRARIDAVTDDFASALAASDLLLLIVPAYAHAEFAAACAPYLEARHVVVLMPGTLGSLEFARVARDTAPKAAFVVAETDTAPYVCRKVSPTSAHIWGIVSALGLGVWPAAEGPRVLRLIERWFQGAQLYAHVGACGLSAMNPIVHPPGVLLNAGRIEHSRGDFYFYDEGVTPAVCRLIEAVDRERRAIGESLGLTLPAVDAAFHAAGFGPRGDLWSTINGSRMLTQLRAPGSLDTRWLSEDVPYGLAAWALLGAQLGVECPLMRSVVDLTSAAVGQDFWSQARTPAKLGIDGLTAGQLVEFFAKGSMGRRPGY